MPRVLKRFLPHKSYQVCLFTYDPDVLFVVVRVPGCYPQYQRVRNHRWWTVQWCAWRCAREIKAKRKKMR